MRVRVYLNVPFREKDEAKQLGARWDNDNKKWYFDDKLSKINNFWKWIFDRNQEESEKLFVYNDLYIIEAKRICYKCHKETKVIGFGVGMYSVFYKVDGDIYEEDSDYDYNNVHLAWAENEDDIPPILRRYIKSKYNVKMGYTKGIGKVFSNHCDFCNSIQGNFYLFGEDDSPLIADTEDREEIYQKMKNLKVYHISLDADCTLLLDGWDVIHSRNDWAYLQFGAIEEITFQEAKCSDITYNEMYSNIDGEHES